MANMVVVHWGRQALQNENKLASFKKGIQYVGWQNIENLGLQRSGHLEIRGIFLSISHFGAVIDYHFSAELKKTCLHKLIAHRCSFAIGIVYVLPLLACLV